MSLSAKSTRDIVVKQGSQPENAIRASSLAWSSTLISIKGQNSGSAASSTPENSNETPKLGLWVSLIFSANSLSISTISSYFAGSWVSLA